MIKSKVQGSRFKVLIFSLLLTAYCLLPEITYAQPTYDSVAAFTAKTTIGVTDIFPFQTKVSNKYTWRKITGASMWDRITDTTEARITALLAASNSWAGINNFDGATFNADAHGKVTFADSVVSATLLNFFAGIFPYNATSFVGSASNPYLRMYSKNFVLVNTAGTDSVYISIDANGKVSIPSLTVTETMSIDSSASFDVIAYTPHEYTVPNIGDTILTLTSTNRYSMIELDLPGNMNPGISRIYVQGAQKGMVLRLYNMDASYAAKFNDYVGNDDNLYLSAGFDFGQYDYLELMCVVESIIGQTWIETGRSNN